MEENEPGSAADLRGLLLDYLDYYRDEISATLCRLSAAELTNSRLPSGWTPAGLALHLCHMEQRWLVWGFLGEQVGTPWGDRAEGGWRTDDRPAEQWTEALTAAGRRTREIVEDHALDERAADTGRFHGDDEPPLLQWILLHVLQEYARHAGHLDIVRELAEASEPGAAEPDHAAAGPASRTHERRPGSSSGRRSAY